MKNEVRRLQIYLDKVNNSLNTATGALKEFWQREAKKTSAKIQGLAK